MHWRGRRRTKSGEETSIDRELAFHVEQATAALVANGMPQAEARRQVFLEFGGAEQVKQRVREMHVSLWRERTVTNLRSALRFVRRSPGKRSGE